MNEILDPCFYPVFSASTISPLIDNSSEATKFRFLKKFKPFSELFPKSSKNNQNSLLSTEQKKFIMSKLEAKTNGQNLEFDDQEILDDLKKLSITSKTKENLKMKESYIGKGDEESFFGKNDEESFFGKNDEESFFGKNDEESFFGKNDEESYTEDSDNTNLEKSNIENNEGQNLNAIRFISTRRGCLYEKLILEKINLERPNKFVQKKQKIYKKYESYEIVGIIDGICMEEKCILEIKTRKNLDMNKKSISKREQIQALVYMHLNASEKCLFVECDPKGELKKTEIPYDEIKYNNIIESLQKFCNFAKTLTRDEFEHLKKKYS